jgi:hypothetical protein
MGGNSDLAFFLWVPVMAMAPVLADENPAIPFKQRCHFFNGIYCTHNRYKYTQSGMDCQGIAAYFYQKQ